MLIYILLLSLVYAGEICKRAGECCKTDFNQCGAMASCLSANQACTLGTEYNCEFTVAAKSLTKDHFHIQSGHGMVNLGYSESITVNYLTFFTNDKDPICSPYDCTIIEAAGAGGACNGGQITATFSFDYTNNLEVSIDSTATFDQYACIRCQKIKTDTQYRVYSNPFRIEISSTGPVASCDGSSSIQLQPTLSSLNHAFTISSGSRPEVSFSAFSDGSGDSCSVTSVEVVVSDTTTSAHADLEWDSTNNKVRIKDTAKYHVATTYNFAIKVTFENSASVIAQTSEGHKNHDFVVSCDSTSTTVSIGSYPTVGGDTPGVVQNVASGASAKYYLPSASSSLVSSDSQASCSITTRTVSSADLSAVQEDANGFYVQPADTSTPKLIKFTYTASAVGGASDTTSELQLNYGCNTADFAFVDPNQHYSQTNYVVAPSGAATTTLQPFQYFISENSNCAAAGAVLVDQSDSLSLISEPVTMSCSTACIITTTTDVNRKPRVLKFKVKQTFTDNVIQTSPEFTITFQCSTDSKAITLDYADGLTWSVPQRSSSNKIHFGPYSCSVASCCTTMNYAVTKGDLSTAYLTPTLETNTSYSFTFDTTTPGTVSYFVKVDSGNGNDANWEAVITVTPVCDNLSTVVLSPGTITGSYSFTISSGVVPETPALPTFSDSGTSVCAVASIDILKSEADPTTHTDLEFKVAGNKIVVKDSAKKDVAQTYTFAIRVNFQNGDSFFPSDSTSATTFSFSVECGSTSTSVSIGSYPTINSVALAAQQFIPDSSGKYYLPEALSSLVVSDPAASCGITTRTVTPSALSTVLQDAHGYYVEPPATAARAYTLTFTASALGGALATYLPEMKLHIGCHSGSSFSDPNPNTVEAYQVQVGSPQTLRAYLFKTSANANCIGSSGFILRQSDSISSATTGLVTADCSSGTSCLLSTTMNDKPRTITFKIEMQYPDGIVQTSELQTVNFFCTSALEALVFDPTTQTLVFPFNEQQNTITVSSIACAAPGCCSSVSASVSKSMAPYPFVDVGGGVITFDFDSSAMGVTSYIVTVQNNHGETKQKLYQITILNPCATQSLFSLSSAQPSGSKLTEISAANGTTSVDPQSQVVLLFKHDVDVSDGFQINLSDRFSSTQCSAADYQITKVEVKDSLTSLSEAQKQQAFSISRSAGFTLASAGSLPQNETYLVTIDVYNGFVWSSFGTPLMEIQICERCAGSTPIPEVAPYFLEPGEEVVQVNATQDSSEIQMELPEVFDPNSDQWAIKVEGSPLAKITSGMKSLVVDISSVKKTTNITFEIVITDSTSKSRRYPRTVEVVVQAELEPDEPEPALAPEEEVAEPGEQPETSTEVDLPLIPGQDIKYVKASIDKITALGELSIKFSEVPLLFLSKEGVHQLNPAHLDLYVRPAARRFEDETFEVSMVNLTWTAESFDIQNKIMKLEVAFAHPLQVSTLATQDTLVVHFKPGGRSLFASAATKDPLSPASWTLENKITRQMPVTEFTKNFEQGAASAEVSLNSLLIATLVLNVLSHGGMIYMLQMIRSLQIVLHFPLLRVIVPANVSLFFSYLIPIVMFDVLDPEWTTELVLNFDEEGQEAISDDILDQMKDLGYETHNSVLNLGSLAIFLVFYFFKLSLFVLALASIWLTGKGATLASFLRNGLFYGDIIAIVLDAYFEFIISGYLQAQRPLWTSSGESVANIVGLTSFALAFIWFPVVQLWQISKSRVECEEEEFTDRWGNLLDGVSTQTRWQRAYFLIFILRRFLFFWIAVGITQHFQFQILCLLALNVAYFLYLGLVRPHASLQIYRIEIFNEFLIHVGTIALLIFTDWVHDGDTQYNAGGYGQIVTITLLLLGNLYYVLASFYKRLLLLVKKMKNLANREFEKRSLQRQSSIPSSHYKYSTDTEDEDLEDEQNPVECNSQPEEPKGIGARIESFVLQEPFDLRSEDGLEQNEALLETSQLNLSPASFKEKGDAEAVEEAESKEMAIFDLEMKDEGAHRDGSESLKDADSSKPPKVVSEPYSFGEIPELLELPDKSPKNSEESPLSIVIQQSEIDKAKALDKANSGERSSFGLPPEMLRPAHAIVPILDPFELDLSQAKIKNQGASKMDPANKNLIRVKKKGRKTKKKKKPSKDVVKKSPSTEQRSPSPTSPKSPKKSLKRKKKSPPKRSPSPQKKQSKTTGGASPIPRKLRGSKSLTK